MCINNFKRIVKMVFLLLPSLPALHSCGNHTYYIVRPDDTLYSIGWAYGYNYKDLASWNHIDPPYIIIAGQLIRFTATARGEGTTPGQRQVVNNPGDSIRVTRQAAKKKVIAGGRNSRQNTPGLRAAAIKPLAKQKTKRLNWEWPTRGTVIQRFNANDPGKKGLKISGTPGQRINAAASGRVVYTGNGLIGYGKLIIIKHSEFFLSAYAHNKKLLVKEGDWVAMGRKIAEMGNTGDRVALHFEVRYEGKPVDPLLYLP